MRFSSNLASLEPSSTVPFLSVSRFLAINVSTPFTVLPVVTVGPPWDLRRFPCEANITLISTSTLTCRLPANIYGRDLRVALNHLAVPVCFSSDSLNISAPFITPNSLRLSAAPSASSPSSNASSASSAKLVGATNDGTSLKFQAGNIGAALGDIAPLVVYYGPASNPMQSTCNGVTLREFDAVTGRVWVYCYTSPGWSQNLFFSLAVGADGEFFTGVDTFSNPSGPSITGVTCNGAGCVADVAATASTGFPAISGVSTMGGVELTVTGTVFSAISSSVKIAGKVCSPMVVYNGSYIYKRLFKIKTVF